MALMCTPSLPLRLPATLGALVLAAACGGETGFSKSSEPPLTEEGMGELEVQPSEIIIEDVDWESRVAKGQVVSIANVGDNNLRVMEVALVSNGGGALYMEEVGELNLAPGAVAEFSIVATLDSFEVVESALRIESGDLDESNIAIPVVAIPIGYDYVPGEEGDTGEGSDSGAR